MTALSPAPWTARGFAIYSGETLVAQVPVAEFSEDTYVRAHARDEAGAKLNLRLISKAPELADVLRELRAAFGNCGTARQQAAADRADSLLAALAAEGDSDV